MRNQTSSLRSEGPDILTAGMLGATQIPWLILYLPRLIELRAQSPKLMNWKYDTTSEYTSITNAVLDILEQYGKHFHTESGHQQLEWIGRTKFFDMVYEQIITNQAIKMILPAFPWKSVSISIFLHDSNLT